MPTRLSQTLGTRRLILLGIAAVGILAFARLGISPSDTIPEGGRLSTISKFFLAALTPVVDSNALGDHCEGRSDHTAVRRARYRHLGCRGLRPRIPRFYRLVAAWGAAQSNPASDLSGDAISDHLHALGARAALGSYVPGRDWSKPYRWGSSPSLSHSVGTFAKIFSEMIDESPRDAADALSASGASPLLVYLYGLVPRALPDILAYILYRFECALRASAVIGFFGIPTLGFYISLAYEDLNFPAVWTHLYVLIFMVVTFDLWSGAARRRIAH